MSPVGSMSVLVVRYEDLKTDTIGVFSQVIRFCGCEDDPARVAKAVDFSRFERVQAQEAAHGFGEKMPLATSFFRKGEVGSWREGLSEALVEKLVADHGEVMRRFGYLDLVIWVKIGLGSLENCGIILPCIFYAQMEDSVCGS